MYLQQRDLNRGPLELRATLLPLSNNGCSNFLADLFFCIIMQLKLFCSNFVVKRLDGYSAYFFFVCFFLPAMVDLDCIRHSYFYIHVIYTVDVDC